ncbi:MAG TPA: YciI family protein [Gemmatimonadaceae bacterium]|nr:YciI family protein [Gemmatimonadaceae bacterium]
MKPTPLAALAALAALTTAFALAIPGVLAAQTQATPAAAGLAMPPGYEIPKDMTTYYLATYIRGPKYIESESAERRELSKRHLSFIRQMIEQKKYLLAGPFADDQGPQLGLAIISAPNAVEAKRIAAADPAIIAGHMAVKVRAAMLPSLASLVVKY